VHNFSLLHDDLVDGDTERRHRPTAWTLRGPAAAILTGDAMLALAQQVLLDVGSRSAVDAARLLGDATQELIRGQFDDLAFERRDDVTVEQCLAMAAGKTGALLAASAAIGAVLAGAPAATVAALWTYGAELGLAFQLVDDVLGIWGDPKVTGKPVGSDLRARKKSLPVTWALAEGGVAGAELREWLAVANSDDDAAVAHATGLVDRAGARQWAQQQASDHLRLADAALDTAGVPAAVRAELVAVGRFVVERQG